MKKQGTKKIKENAEKGTTKNILKYIKNNLKRGTWNIKKRENVTRLRVFPSASKARTLLYLYGMPSKPLST